MKSKQTIAEVRANKVKKEKKSWTKESALEYVKKAQIKGLKYWAAADYLKKVHNILVDEYKG